MPERSSDNLAGGLAGGRAGGQVSPENLRRALSDVERDSLLTPADADKITEPAAGVSATGFSDGPGPVWLAIGFVLAGIGTVMLGPLLPWLSRAWKLSDEQGGVLLAVKFVGSFLGGVSVPRRLRIGILRGAVLCCAGFGLFSFASGLPVGIVSLFIAGFGLGHMIASTNILVSRRYTRRPGAALALLNLFWSLGAVITGLLVAVLLPRFGMHGPLLAFAGLFLLTGAAGSPGLWAGTAAPDEVPANERSNRLTAREFLYFASLLFLYGGLETSLSGWLTTYSLRFSDKQWLAGQAAIVLLWSAITVGRGLTSLLMRWWPEGWVRNIGLGVTLVALLGLVSSSHSGIQLASCVGLGLGLAPFFPASFARLTRHRPTARIAGLVLAVSGLGAALFPWLVGVVSARTGSLRVALSVPFLLATALLVLGFREPKRT